MSSLSQVGPWSLALACSLALHGAVAVALGNLSALERRDPVATEILIETVASGSVSTIAPAEALPPASVDGAAPPAADSASALAPVAAPAPVQAEAAPDILAAAIAQDATQVAPASLAPAAPVSIPQAESAPPVFEANPLASVAEDLSAASATDAPVAVAAVAETGNDLQPAQADALAPVAEEPVAASKDTAQDQVDAAPVEAPLVLPSDSAAETATPLPVADAAPVASVSDILNAIAAEDSIVAPSTEDIVVASSAADSAVADVAAGSETVASAVETAEKVQPAAVDGLAPVDDRVTAVLAKPSLDRVQATVAETPALHAVLAPEQNAAPRAAAGAAAAVVVAPVAVAPVVEARPATSVTPLAAAPGPAKQAVVAPPAQTTLAPVAPATAPIAAVVEASPPSPVTGPPAVATVLAPVEETADGDPQLRDPEGGSEAVAMLAPNTVTTDTETGSGRVNVALGDFLKTYEGGDCMLAVPTGADRMEAFSDLPTSVYALRSQYRREAGVLVTAEPKTVSKAQCSTLSFSRSLAQYPNYPLQVELDAPTIRSGTVLSGRVAGLRKNTLYLFVVDDEGKAKLVDRFLGLTTTSIAFNAPMTLTAGPVTSVQLLVAIASDGQLKSVATQSRAFATKSGMMAETFFGDLAREIRNDNRSIHFGITSFVVR